MQRAGGEPVPDGLGGGPTGIQRDAPVERRGDVGVPAGPAPGRLRGDEGVAHQGVGEGVPGCVPLTDQAGRDGMVEDVDHLVHLGAGRGGQQQRVELPADHRRREQGLPGRPGQPGEPGQHDVADPTGNLVGRPVVAGPPADQLGDEEGIAVGPRPDLPGPGVQVGVDAPRGRVAGRRGEQGPDIVGGQAGQLQADGVAPGQHLAQRGQGRRRVHDRPTGDHDRHPGILEPVDDVGQQRERRRVGPVRIVHHDQQRARRGRRPQAGGHRLPPVEPGALGREGIDRGRHGEAGGQGPNRVEARRAVVVRIRPSVRQLGQNPGPRPERRGSRVGRTRGGQDRHAGRLRTLGRLRDEPGLADARLADQQRRARPTAGRPLQQTGQRSQLGLPSDQR